MKTQELIAQAVSEKEAIEMKEMKPSEANPNDTVLPRQESIIPPAVTAEAEKTGDVSVKERVENPQEERMENPQEERVEIPSQEIATEVVSAEGVTAAAAKTEANK